MFLAINLMVRMKSNKNDFIEKLESGIKDLNISYSREQLEQLWEYYLFFREENKKYNMSTITEPEPVIKKHFLDSLVILKQLNFKGRKRWLDIGTGAGFPGMVLKLFLPGDSFYLLDSSSKKVNFLNQLIYRLSLKGIDATHGRAEDREGHRRLGQHRDGARRGRPEGRARGCRRRNRAGREGINGHENGRHFPRQQDRRQR